MALNLTLKVHPVVLMQIIDSYERRNMDSFRVIGTLVGTVDKGVVEATNAFCVPHKESDQGVEMDLTYAADMFDFNEKVNKQEAIVGWFATGYEITSQSSVIHDYYSRECPNPIHLTLDTTLQNSRMGLKAYINIALGTPNGKVGWMFTPIPVEVVSYEPEVVAYRLLQKTIAPKQRCVPLTDDLEQIVQATDKLKRMVDSVLSYVDEVLQGKRQGDNEVGRALLGMVHNVPKMSTEEFGDMFNSNVKDLLMIVSLAQLVETQLQLNEKLTFLTIT